MKHKKPLFFVTVIALTVCATVAATLITAQNRGIHAATEDNVTTGTSAAEMLNTKAPTTETNLPEDEQTASQGVDSKSSELTPKADQTSVWAYAQKHEKIDINTITALSNKKYDLTWDDFGIDFSEFCQNAMVHADFYLNSRFYFRLGGYYPDGEILYAYLCVTDEKALCKDIRGEKLSQFICDYSAQPRR